MEIVFVSEKKIDTTKEVLVTPVSFSNICMIHFSIRFYEYHNDR